MNFLTQILGTTDYVSFAAACFFALIGVLLSLLFHSTTRDIASTRTPIPFDWSFLVSDNAKRLVIGIICVFIAMRFSSELIGSRLTLFIAFIIGLSIDKLATIIQNKILK